MHKLHLLSGALLVLAGLMLAGCSVGSLSAGVAGSSVPTVSPTGVVDVTPGATQTIKATAGATPASTSNLSLLPTATPAPTARPADAPLVASDYYVVSNICEAGGYSPCGVVDIHGRTVLPVCFASVTVLEFEPKNAATKQQQSIVYFFAKDFNINEPIFLLNLTGYIYNANGKKVSNHKFIWAYQLTPTIIAAVEPNGKSYWLEFLDSKLKLLQRIQIKYNDVSIVDDLIAAYGMNEKMGFIDKSMKWIAKPQWDGFDDAGSWGGEYNVCVNDEVKCVNRYGREFLPKGYDECWPCGDGEQKIAGHYVFSAQGDKGIAIINDEGKILFAPDQNHVYSNIDYCDGVLILDGHVVDWNGKELLPGVDHVVGWNKDTHLFECCDWDAEVNNDDDGLYNYTYYTADGKKLPLPEGIGVDCLSADRFAVCFDKDIWGICNAQGQWILKPTDMRFDEYLRPAFSVKNAAGKNKYGLMDNDGNIILKAAYDYLSPDGDLFDASYGSISGLIDTTGHWVWYTSDYDTLMD